MKSVYTKLFGLVAIVTSVILLLSCGVGGDKVSGAENDTSEIQRPLMVFAAASLTDVISELIDSFNMKYNVRVQTNMASSGTLARQIEQGGTPDVYISASKRWADYIDSSGYFIVGTKTTIAKNELVLIAPQNSSLKVDVIDSSLNFLALLGDERLSMGDPSHVPAGKYAKQSLDYFGWYDKLNGKTLPAKDVRSALMVVELEESPLGVVYRTDAQKSEKVKVLGTFPETSHKPIMYVGGVCQNNATARKFLEYLNMEETKAIWEKYGFKK